LGGRFCGVNTPSLGVFVGHLLLALTLGSLIGLERQWHRRLVDLKTNSLVCLGAALFMQSSATASGFVEPVRMAAQIVVGVGFIGGGLLLREGHKTVGINTAATLWCCAAIGTLCGLGRVEEATLATVLLVGANKRRPPRCAPHWKLNCAAAAAICAASAKPVRRMAPP
jgi:putative Mg2+ transporter-C (MgtC) family protein